ncbi:OCIA domain-containing protein 1-like isoform X2 [Channa argus]|uniref:OCIA domain-containing protein 1-like isoform X2 n=1 Tax=Channa argus TaxID=215402 RepID=UPI003520044E
MSSTTSGFPEERQYRGARRPVGMDYIPTDEEKRVFRECNQESFLYRFAGFCGYLAGKMSYMKTCQEKFKRLENSPLGEALRQRTGLPTQYPESDQQSFDTMLQPAEASSQMPTNTRDYGYGYNPEPPMQIHRADDSSTPVQSYVEEEEPRKKPILYEDLRVKNRENYEVTLTQKAETLLKTPPEKDPERPKKQLKQNIYGDTWEE